MKFVFYTDNDVDAFLKSNFSKQIDNIQAISLSPSAYVKLIENGIEVCAQSHELFTDEKHTQCEFQAFEFYDEAKKFFDVETDFSSATKHILLLHLMYLSFPALKIYYTLESFEIFYIYYQGKWIECRHETVIQEGLLDKISGLHRRFILPFTMPAFPRIYKILRSSVMNLSSLLRRSWYILPLTDHMKVEKDAFQAGANILKVSVSNKGYQNYWQLLKSLLKIFRVNKNMLLHVSILAEPVSTKRKKCIEAFFQELLERIKSRPIKQAFKLAISNFICTAIRIEEISLDLEKILHKENIKHILYSDFTAYIDVLMAHVLETRNLTIVNSVMNYNSIANNTNKMSCFLAHARYANNLSQKILCWSKSARNATQNTYFVDGLPIIENISIKAFSPLERPINNNSELFHILHADNFYDWFFYLPSIVHSSDEYAYYCKVFVETLATSDLKEEVAVAIRLKNKKECSPEILKNYIPQLPFVDFQGTKKPYREELKKADLVVAYMSTTIEEALLYRKPVLLNGAANRYQHLRASSELPTSTSRSAVYVADGQKELIDMLKAIKKYHKNKPLTDEELAPYFFSEPLAKINRIIGTIK